MTRKIILLISIVLPAIVLMGQGNPPELRCLGVNTDGSVRVNWIKPTTTTGFQSYEIYYSESQAGPYFLAGTVSDFDTEEFTHTGINAQDDSFFYYIVANYTSGPSPPSETLQTILLLLFSSDPETALLNWNSMRTPPLPTSSQWYYIYMENPPGNWSLLDSTQQTEYTAKFFECNNAQEIISFRVEQPDQSGCSSVSSVKGELLYNFRAPEIPEMDSVSITGSGDVIIGRQPTPSQDTRGYVIYLVTSTNDSIDFVEGAGNTSYVHTGVNPCLSSYTYAIAAVDSCGNESAGTFGIPQQTLLIEPIQYDACYMSNLIEWNEYINFDPSVGRYELYVSIDGGPATVLAALDSTSFVHENLGSNTTYTYFVRAYSQDDTKSSTSCTRSITTYDSPRPDFLYLRKATVVNNDHVDLLFYTDTSAFVNFYRILRAEQGSGPFEEIGTLPGSEEENLTFSDLDAEVNSRSYYYRITVIDSCGIESEIANDARSIFLSVQANDDRTNFLEWNSYESWDGGVESYEIYRLINSQPDPPGPLAVVTAGTLSFTDDVSYLGGTNAIVEYYVKAIEGTGNSFGFMEEAISNTATALQESKVFIPNAFAPDGINRVFKPASSFISPDNYLFAIYDRFGREIFSTTNPGEGWDGSVEGEPAPHGVYVYLLRYNNTSQQTNSVTGTVVLLY